MNVYVQKLPYTFTQNPHIWGNMHIYVPNEHAYMCIYEHICVTVKRIYVHMCTYMRELHAHICALKHVYMRSLRAYTCVYDIHLSPGAHIWCAYMLLFAHICATIYVVFGSYMLHIYARNEHIYVRFKHIYVLVLRIERAYMNTIEIYMNNIYEHKMHIYVHRRPRICGIGPKRPLLMRVFFKKFLKILKRYRY